MELNLCHHTVFLFNFVFSHLIEKKTIPYLLTCRWCEERAQLRGLQPGLLVQHRRANLHRQRQLAAYRRRPRLPGALTASPGDLGGPGPRPDPVPYCQPGPQSDLPGPVDGLREGVLT